MKLENYFKRKKAKKKTTSTVHCFRPAAPTWHTRSEPKDPPVTIELAPATLLEGFTLMMVRGTPRTLAATWAA